MKAQTTLLMFILFLFSGVTVNASEFINSEQSTALLVNRPSKPVITSHNSKSQLNNTDVIRGTAEAGNQIELSMESVYKGGKSNFGTHLLSVDENGLWYFNNPGVWLPAGASNPAIRISATQINSAGARSKPVKLTLAPGTDILEIRGGLLDEPAVGSGSPVERSRGDVIVRDLPPNLPKVLPAPNIISPKLSSTMNRKDKIRLLGTAGPGAAVSVMGSLAYNSSGKEYAQDFNLNVVADENGVWVTPYLNPDLPPDASEAEYRFMVTQSTEEIQLSESASIVFSLKL